MFVVDFALVSHDLVMVCVTSVKKCRNLGRCQWHAIPSRAELLRTTMREQHLLQLFVFSVTAYTVSVLWISMATATHESEMVNSFQASLLQFLVVILQCVQAQV